jgi:tetratricopeptide (TPR) repeat protein
MMRALISGQAGMAVLLEEEPLYAVAFDAPDEVIPCRVWSDVRVLFAGAEDVTEMDTATHESAIEALDLAWAKDRAMQLTLVLLDSKANEDTRKDAAECVTELFEFAGVEEFVANRLFASPMPKDQSDLSGAIELAGEIGETSLQALLLAIRNAQPRIIRLRKLWNDLPSGLFQDGKSDAVDAKVEKLRVESVLILIGVFRRLAQASPTETMPIVRWCTSATSEHRISRRIITEWLRELTATGRVATEDRFISDEREDEDKARIPRGRQGTKDRRQRQAHEKGFAENLLERALREVEGIVTLWDEGQEEQAEDYLQELIARQLETDSIDPAVKSLCNLAIKAKERGRFQLQLRLTEWAYELAPREALAMSQRADALLCLGQFEKALAGYDQAVRLFSSDPVNRTGRAETLRQLGRFEDALTEYDTAVLLFPSNPLVRCGRAETLRQMRRLEEALVGYDEALQLFSFDSVVHNGRAETLRQMGRLEEALAGYNDAVRLFPSYPATRNGRAETLKQMGRLEEALAGYDDAVRLFPSYPATRNGRAETLKRMGRLEEALAGYDEAIRLFPYDAVSRNGRANVLMELGRYLEALAMLPETGMCEQNDWVGYHIRGMVYLRQGQTDEAVSVFEKGLSECPFFSQRMFFAKALAVARIRQRKWREAEDTLAGRTDEAAQVLRIHIQGELKNYSEVVTKYQSLSETRQTTIAKLRDTLVSRYLNANARKQPPSNEWLESVFRQECELVSAIAA